jgi:hypothetical protein
MIIKNKHDIREIKANEKNQKFFYWSNHII